MITIHLTTEQATALLQMIDVAVKSQGLLLAANGVFFHNLINEAAKAEAAAAAAPKVDNPSPS